jgi:flagellar assembly protein FliH
MSRRIIRGDGRVHDMAETAPNSTNVGRLTQDRIMNVEQQAFERGYAEGESIGKQMGETMMETLCGRYEKSLADLAATHKKMIQAMEEQTVRLAIEIARKIVQRELTMDPDLVAALAAVALKRVASHQSITLCVSRVDLERVRAAVAIANSAVTVKEDPALERGDFLIETGQTHLDGRASSQVDTIGRALFDE